MKRLSLHEGVEVLPALYGRHGTAQTATRGPEARFRFDNRTTRSQRFPVEQSLARPAEPSRLGRFLDIEV